MQDSNRISGRVFLQRLSFYQLCVSLGLQSCSHFSLKPKDHHSSNAAWAISPFSGDGAKEVDFTVGHCSATLMLGVNQRPTGCQHGAVFSTTSHFSPLQPMSFAGSIPQIFYCMSFTRVSTEILTRTNHLFKKKVKQKLVRLFCSRYYTWFIGLKLGRTASQLQLWTLSLNFLVSKLSCHFEWNLSTLKRRFNTNTDE